MPTLGGHTKRKNLGYEEGKTPVSEIATIQREALEAIDELNDLRTTWMQAGVVESSDWSMVANINSGTGALGSTGNTGGKAHLPDPVATGDLMPSVTTPATLSGLAPTLPSSTKYVGVAYELTPSTWGAAAVVSVHTGAEQATQLAAEEHMPATTAGKIQVRRVVVKNTAGVYSIVAQFDVRVYAGLGPTVTQVKENLGLNDPSIKRRGFTNIATEQSRENTAYGVLATPDEVTVELPANGLIVVGYQATWQTSVAGAARAALFLNGVQVQIARSGNGSPVAAETNVETAGAVGHFVVLSSAGNGLVSLGAEAYIGAYTGDVTTGQILSAVIQDGGPCCIFAAAGTYKVSVQFKATSGRVTAKNRKLWVKAEAFS
jgi:hypothetical protein